MKMTIVPGACETQYRSTAGSYCESCFARFLARGGEGELACMTAVEDDGVEAKTLVLQYGNYEQTLALTDEVCEDLAYGGWQGWKAFVEQLPLMTAV